MLEFEMLCDDIARHYGEANQLNQLQEELAELIVAINKYRRNADNITNLVEEIADVEIMLRQIKYLLALNPDYLEGIRINKLLRQEGRIKEEKSLPRKRIVVEADIPEEEIIGIKEQIAEVIPNARVVEVK